MTLGTLLDDLAQLLAGPDVPPSRADARDLIAAALDRPRFWPSAHAALELDPSVEAAIRGAAERMRLGMPLQYAVGKAAFRHLTLQVDKRVLIPRPETELLVDVVLAAVGRGGTIADVCTGSGAIALALATEGQFDRIIATDISAEALEVAQANLTAVQAEIALRATVGGAQGAQGAQGAHGDQEAQGAQGAQGASGAPRSVLATVEFRQGDLLAPLAGERLQAIVANPPYIAPVEAGDLPSLVRDWEPHLALFSEDDGMRAIRAIVRGAPELLVPGGLLAVEIDVRRADVARACAEEDPRWAAVALRMDLTGRERFLVAQRNDAP